MFPLKTQAALTWSWPFSELCYIQYRCQEATRSCSPSCLCGGGCHCPCRPASLQTHTAAGDSSPGSAAALCRRERIPIRHRDRTSLDADPTLGGTEPRGEWLLRWEQSRQANKSRRLTVARQVLPSWRRQRGTGRVRVPCCGPSPPSPPSSAVSSRRGPGDSYLSVSGGLRCLCSQCGLCAPVQVWRTRGRRRPAPCTRTTAPRERHAHAGDVPSGAARRQRPWFGVFCALMVSRDSLTPDPTLHGVGTDCIYRCKRTDYGGGGGGALITLCFSPTFDLIRPQRYLQLMPCCTGPMSDGGISHLTICKV